MNAMAITTGVSLLLIDEMSLGLAPVIYESLFPIVRAFASSTNCAVLLVEQHVQRALAIADRAYLIERGTIIATGSGAEMRVRTAALAHAYLGSDASIVANRGDTSVGEA